MRRFPLLETGQLRMVEGELSQARRFVADPTYTQLVHEIAHGRGVLFVGAGSSCRVGYPTWSDLIRAMADKAIELNPAARTEIERRPDPLLRAQYIKSVLGSERIQDIIVRLCGPRNPSHDSFHEALVSLPFKQILTTNYDNVLESAHEAHFDDTPSSLDVDEVDRLSTVWDHFDDRRSYIHVHGSARRAQFAVLSQDEYAERYTVSSRLPEFLKNVFGRDRVLFVGYSLSDEDLLSLLKRVGVLSGARTPRHFAICERPHTNADARALELKEKYRVATILYDNATGDHEGAHDILLALKRDVHRLHTQQNAMISRAETSHSLRSAFQRQPEICDTIDKVLDARPVRFADSAAATSQNAFSTLDAQITETFDLVTLGFPDKAIFRYEELRKVHEGCIQPRLLYRLEANIGNARLAKGEPEAAAAHFLRATAYWKGSKEARACEVFGYYLRGDYETSKQLAWSLCGSEPGYARAWAHWVQSHQEDIQYDVILKQVPSDLRHDAEVAVALAEMARRIGDERRCEEWARRALDTAPSWIDAQVLVANATLRLERDANRYDVDKGFICDRERVEECVALLSTAITSIPQSDPAKRLAGILYNRALAHRMLGQTEEEARDLDRAFQLSPVEPEIAVAKATRVDSPVAATAALETIEAMSTGEPQSDQLAFATALLLRWRSRDDDRNRALRIVEARIESADATRLWDLVRLGLELLVDVGEQWRAPLLVGRLATDRVTEIQRALLTGLAYVAMGDLSTAVHSAREAIALTDSHTSWLDRREAALLAERCELYEEASNLWSALLGDDATGSDTVHLVHCAFKAHRLEDVLSVCERLRVANRLLSQHFEWELQTLVRTRQKRLALTRIEAWLARHPEDKFLRLSYAALAIEAHEQDRVIIDEADYPDITEVQSASEGQRLVYVIRHGNRPHRSLEIAYALYRRFRDDPIAQFTLISSVFFPMRSRIEVESPIRVDVGCAVLIKRIDDATPARWVYLHNDADRPELSVDEHGASHLLSRTLIGRALRDEVMYGDRCYRIEALLSNPVARARQLMSVFNERFPESGLLRQIEAPTVQTGSADGKKNELLELLREQERYRNNAASEYGRHRLPLESFGRVLGRNVFELMQLLAFDPQQRVHMDSGAPNLLWPTLIAIDTTPRVILDSSALASIAILGLADALRHFGVRWILPESVHEELLQSASNVDLSRHGGVIGTIRGVPFIHSWTDEELDGRATTIRRLIEWVTDNCEIAAAAFLECDIALQQQLEECLGAAAFDALLLAKQRHALLWTDDCLAQTIARTKDVSVSVAWTQAVMMHAAMRGRISSDNYLGCVRDLLLRGYRFLRVSPEDCEALFRQAKWRRSTRLGAELIEFIAEATNKAPDNANLTARILGLVWSGAPTRYLARNLVVAILDAIDRELIDPLFQNLVRNSGAAPKGRGSLSRLLRAWKSQKGECRPGRGTKRYGRVRRITRG